MSLAADTTYGFPGATRCCPWPPQPQPWFPPSRPQYGQNLPDAEVGNRWNCWWREPVRGYGLDLNGDGRYDRGQDGVLAFDFNRDGRLDDNEIGRSNAMLKAYGGNYDLNGDGNVDFWERIQGEKLRKQAAKYDTNRDGRFDAHELSQAGGRVWVDRDRDGRADQNETHSPYSIPGPYGGSRRLDVVDPYWNYNRTSDNNWFWGWNPPWLHNQYPSYR